MSLHRRGRRPAYAVVIAIALATSALTLATTAQAAPLPGVVHSAARPGPHPASGAGDGGSATGGGDGLVTFGVTTASQGASDSRGYISFDVPPGSVMYDNVAAVNFSTAPLDVDLYPADVTNSQDGSLDVAGRDATPRLAGSWVSVGESTVALPAQSAAQGPGLAVVPVTITVPSDAEPGDHLAAVLSSITTQGQPGENTPAVNLEQRVGVRVYVRVQGDIRPGLTITGVHPTFRAGSALGSGTLEVDYTLTNSGNVRYGIKPSVRATGPFGLAPHGADGTTIQELLPHSSVTQTVTLDGVVPLLLENVVVSATGVAAPGGQDPAIGVVHASAWTWLWSWLLLVLLLLVGALIAWRQVRRRRRRPGVWGPPPGLWDTAPPAPDGPVPAAEHEPGPSREPVR